MKYNKYKKVIVAIMIMLVVVSVFPNCVDAKINDSYYDEIKQTATVSNSALSSILSSDLLADPIARLVYSIGNFLEYLVGAVVLAASGTNVFPWADAIVFNAIPMLDVNFISPDSGSFAYNLKTILQGLYASMFTIAEAFFGIAVFIMGIKLAISAIAAEKAKYKDALVRWVMGLVLLFGMQFFISFVFYLNEQLVIVASNIASDALENSNYMESLEEATNSISDEEITRNFSEAVTGDNVLDWISTITTFGLSDLINWAEDEIVSAITGNMNKAEAVEYLNANANITAMLLKDSEFREATGLNSAFVSGKANQFWTWQDDATGRHYLKLVAANVQIVNNASLDELYSLYTEKIQAYNEDTTSEKARNDRTIAKALYNAKEVAMGQQYTGEKHSIITGLASYFKNAAWAMEDGGWKPTKAVLENAVLYAILVVQSVTLLISYIKRLFYVIVLALTAPIVVVFDFIKKV